jgi:hypothetical protein
MRHSWAYNHVRSHPPRCLAGFRWRADGEAVAAVRAKLGGSAVMFELLPTLPNETPVLLGRYLDDEWPSGWDTWFQGRILVSPLAIRWEPSGQVVEMFDGSCHGYNPEHDLGPVHKPGLTERLAYQWPVEPCCDPVFVVCLSYQFEEELELEGKQLARPEDFFEWFTLAAWSRQNGSVHFATDFECA